IDKLLEGIDVLNTMVDDTANSNNVEITDLLKDLQKILEEEAPVGLQEIDTKIFFCDKEGNPTEFETDLFILSNNEDKNIYKLTFNLTKIETENETTPLLLIKKLLEKGAIIDTGMRLEDSDLREGLPKEPLFTVVIFATGLDKNSLMEIYHLDEKDIIPLENRVDEYMAAAELAGEEPAEEEQPVAVVEDIPAPVKEPEVKAEPKPKEIKIKPPEPKAKIEEKKSPAPAAEKKGTDSSSSVRIHVDLLDKLMRLASELVLVRNQQLTMVDVADPVSRNIMQRLDIVTSELQEAIMLTRMQPIGNVFNKTQRMVREISNKLGKRIELSIAGKDVELDKTILESLTDPLTHIIRNSCDHGIEMPDEREESGKLPVGKISLRAYHEGGQINIEIRDDGKGLDPERIKNKALEKGLKTEAELNNMGSKEINSLIMLPGFSTAESVSDLSGRGVGMDVVKVGIEKLNGSIELDSTPGRGTKIQLRLPLTLAIIPCLIVEVVGERYAIPQVNLEELVCLYDTDVKDKIEIAGDREVFRLRDHLLPMIRLNEILHRSTAFNEEAMAKISEKYRQEQKDLYDAYLVRKQELENDEMKFSQSLNFAVLRIGTFRFGLIVDNVLGTEEIVVKPIHPVLKTLPCYSGATVMGDGKVALILDVEGTAKYAGLSKDEDTDLVNENEMVAGETNKQTILLFKNGPSEQFAAALPLIRRIERIKVSDIEQIGDKEFVSVDGVSTRVLCLDKVLSVTPFEKNEEAFLLLPKHIKRPFGILASKLVDIEDTSFELNIESYMDDGLLGTAILNEHLTLFVDIYRLIELSEPDWFEERKKVSPPPGDPKSILLVEDSSFFRELIKGYLESDGYQIVTANNGQEGLDRANEYEIDLVVSDLDMPVMNGFEFITNLKTEEKFRDTKSIALTALDSERDKEKALDCGFDRYEIKMERERFLSVIAEMLMDDEFHNEN
ncbi:MAG: chemotaxis protein CheW, partial [Rhodothermaceae bacterium]